MDAALSYTIILTQSPALSESHLTAQGLVSELIAQGDKIDRIFFYQDAAFVGLKSQIPGQGLQPSYQGWLDLQQKQNFPLQICIANALRRGIVDKTEAQRYQCLETLQAGFQLSGLGEIADACQSSDRIITL
ncbi:MAG: sulfurtransferase complex subunit TusD [Oleispira sp.]|nr:sulfurtransferase complex subunit TusD [Oleispira sp.]